MAAAPQQPTVQAPYQQPIFQAPTQQPTLQALFQQPTLQAPPTYALQPRQTTMGTKQAHMSPGQGQGYPAVDRPPLMQSVVQEGEPLLFGIMDDPPSYMQAAPVGLHEDYVMDLDDPVQAPQPQ